MSAIWEFKFRFYKGRVSKRGREEELLTLRGVARDVNQNNQASFTKLATPPIEVILIAEEKFKEVNEAILCCQMSKRAN